MSAVAPSVTLSGKKATTELRPLNGLLLIAMVILVYIAGWQGWVVAEADQMIKMLITVVVVIVGFLFSAWLCKEVHLYVGLAVMAALAITGSIFLRNFWEGRSLREIAGIVGVMALVAGSALYVTIIHRTKNSKGATA